MTGWGLFGAWILVVSIVLWVWSGVAHWTDDVRELPDPPRPITPNDWSRR